jgi:hypothetical protein
LLKGWFFAATVSFDNVLLAIHRLRSVPVTGGSRGGVQDRFIAVSASAAAPVRRQCQQKSRLRWRSASWQKSRLLKDAQDRPAVSGKLS